MINSKDLKLALIKMNSLTNVTLLVLSAVMSVFLAEGIFFAVNTFHDRNSVNNFRSMLEKIEVYDGQVAQDLDFFQYHPIYGHIGVPGISGSLGGYRTTTNSKGYRDTEHAYAKPADTKRVVLLGDSEVWGIGTHDDETLPYHLSRILNATPSKEKYEVISLGVSGYGFDQSYLQYLVEGLYYLPDYVVLVFFGENDVSETYSQSAWGIEKPRFFMKETSLCLTNIPPKRASGWRTNKIGNLFDRTPESLLKYSSYLPTSNIIRFFQNREIPPGLLEMFSSERWKTWHSGNYTGPFSRLADEIPCFEEHPSEKELNRNDAVSLSLSVLIHLKQSVQEHNAKLLIIGKPPFDEYLGNRNPNSDYSKVSKQLESHSFSYVDMLNIGKSKNISPQDFFTVASHLSSMGHQITAEEIRSWIDSLKK